MAVMRRHMLELGRLHSKACVEEAPWPAMSRGKIYAALMKMT